MVCVNCGAETRVINSRFHDKSSKVWRRRRCQKCLLTFTTYETPSVDSYMQVTGQNDSLSDFSRDKLLISIYESCRHRDHPIRDAAALVDTCIDELKQSSCENKIRHSDIIEVVGNMLERFDPAAATHYDAFHRL